MTDNDTSRRAGWRWGLLALPYVALLWLPFYNAHEPAIAGFPFFYWYQLACVPVTSLLLYAIYRRIR
jgi:hypothetical protein